MPASWPTLPPPPPDLPPEAGATAGWAAPRLLGDAESRDGVPWARIARDALDFPVPMRSLGSDLRLLELFHGPTLSFKDVGARFLARLLAVPDEGAGGSRTILVATSGDTGGAVAHAVRNVPGIRAVILFPRGRVSEVQRRQFTTAGPNVLAVEVQGPFDRCQALVKGLLGNPAARARFRLTSANSINPGRLLPQTFYYLHLARLLGWGREGGTEPGPVIVPSGNLGNVTAGVLARRTGAPLGPLVAACNRNDALVRFEADGETREVPVRPTASSAMDVGRPSNLERLEDLFDHDHAALAREVPAVRISEDETREAMVWAFRAHEVILDPHTAVGVAAVLRGGLPGRGIPTVLATAHPAKFPEVVEAVLGRTPERPPGLTEPTRPERLVRLEGDLDLTTLAGLLAEGWQ